MVLEKNRRLPISFEVYSGSILDVVTLKRGAENLRSAIPDMEITLDRGFFSYENLAILQSDSYIIVASLVSKAVKNVFHSTSRTVDRVDNVITYQE